MHKHLFKLQIKIAFKLFIKYFMPVCHLQISHWECGFSSLLFRFKLCPYIIGTANWMWLTFIIGPMCDHFNHTHSQAHTFKQAQAL